MDLESKIPDKLEVHFTDGSAITLTGYNLAYIWLHLKAASDLIPLLYRSNASYSDEKMTIPVSALLEQGAEVEPRTR
jgi:hypothetical protein